jgi:ribonuclease HI
VPAAGFFSDREEGAHINELELTTALNALRAFLPFARERHVQLVTDSLVTTHVVRNYTSRSPPPPYKAADARLFV